MKESFNLIDQPWIKVIDRQNQEQLVSLTELFKKAEKYRQIAGDSKSQDFVVLRLLLAILTRVYMNSCNQDELVNEWNETYQSRKFSASVYEYLEKYRDSFDFFGDKPFYQVTQETYDQHVDTKKQIKNGKGTVSIKQINRTVSESNNSPSVFSPRSELNKNKISLDELVRWIITYQNYSGVTDKTKVKSNEKFSVSPGYAYKLGSFFARGKTLFDTLMLNLVLDPNGQSSQKPVWEYDINDYIDERLNALQPDNICDLYTVWSRMLYIEWNNDTPTIFSAGLPKFNINNVKLEPMTTWKYDKKESIFKPAVKTKSNLNVAMWRNFGQYTSLKTKTKFESQAPGLIRWLNKLKNKKIINLNSDLDLVAVSMASDGNATSQAPYAEFNDSLRIKVNVLFDEDPELEIRWPNRIEDTIKQTQTVATDVWVFAKNISELLGIKDKDFASKVTSEFYDQLNNPFNAWLSSITIKDDQDKKILVWRKELERIAAQFAKELVMKSPNRVFLGKFDDKTEKYSNILIFYNHFRHNVVKHLRLGKR